jgi:glycerol kinase
MVRPKVSETTALGAPYLAGLAVGYWKDTKEIAAQWQTDRRFVSSIESATRKKLVAGWAKALARARNWAEK